MFYALLVMVLILVLGAIGVVAGVALLSWFGLWDLFSKTGLAKRNAAFWDKRTAIGMRRGDLVWWAFGVVFVLWGLSLP